MVIVPRIIRIDRLTTLATSEMTVSSNLDRSPGCRDQGPAQSVVSEVIQQHWGLLQ